MHEVKPESQNLAEVVCLVFEKDGKLLLEQRLDKETKNHWTFTGGKVDPEDRLAKLDYKEAASIREAREETNLVPSFCRHLETFEEVSITGKSYIFHAIVVESWSGRLKNLEAGRRRLRWIPIREAQNYIGGNKVDRRVLEAYLHHVNSPLLVG